jgi:hypothetical protein
MNIKKSDDNTTYVTLSRRNLQQLLNMLDKKVGRPCLTRLLGEGRVLLVQAEEDVEHYNSEDREQAVRGIAGPGFNHGGDVPMVGIGPAAPHSKPN